VRRTLVPIAIVASVVLGGLALAPRAQAADPYDWPAPAPVSPGPSASSDGDFATDTYGDPWDFSNPEDFPSTPEVGVQYGSANISGGALHVSLRGGSEVRLVFDWPGVIPWGRDGRKYPIDASRYSVLSFRACNNGADASPAVRWEQSTGGRGQAAFTLSNGCHDYSFDLTHMASVQLPAPWAGTITRLVFVTSPSMPATTWDFDYVRLHRPGTSNTPANVPHARVLSPNETGQGDYATDVRGDAWDMSQSSDVGLGDAVGSVSGGVLNASNTTNDPSVELAVPVPFDGGDYHRATISVCYDGGFSLANAPGGGMVGRFQWITEAVNRWSESQDIVVFPGCQTITVDLRSDPTTLIHDEASIDKPGFCGRKIIRFRFDPHEDPGGRAFHIDDVKLEGDPHFATTYDIGYTDSAGVATSADLYASTSPNAFDGGTMIARGVSATGTFRWNGHDVNGGQMAAGSYWIYVVEKGNGTSSARSSAPVRFDPPGADGLGDYVGIVPYRVLDTRVGPYPVTGCHAPVRADRHIDVQIAGVPGLPATGVTAVAVNVTAVNPTAPTYLSVYPAPNGPTGTSNLNAGPGQVIPNLVIAKVGAGGKIGIYNAAGDTDVIADIVGYYTNTSASKLVPIVPERALDTRPTGPVGPAGTIDVGFSGMQRVPSSGVTAVAINVTAVAPSAPTYLTVWPSGDARPVASNVNAGPGQVIPNLVMAKLGPNGKVSIFNLNGNTNVLVDVVGYYTSGAGSRLTPIVPERATDTRGANGVSVNPIGPGGTLDVDLTHLARVPSSGVKAVAVNVTAIFPSAPTYLTVWPTGDARPGTSNLNAGPGQVIPNLVIAKVGAGGKISIFNLNGNTDVAVDVVGYFS
jgi:hypothetical protein